MGLSFKEIAQQYVDKEMSVTPIDGRKIPILGSGWNQVFLADVFKPEYDKRWRAACGLGLLCGEPSGVIMLDIDVVDSETNPSKVAVRDELLANLPPVFSGRTGSKHKPTARFYKYEGQSTERFIALDIEILSTGVHCALPPSTHSEGNLYEWVNKSLLDIELDDLPSLPEDLIVWLRRKNLEVKGDYKPEKLLRSEKGRCKSGSHNYLSSIGVALRYAGHPYEAVLARLISEDQKINHGEDALYFHCKSRRWRGRDLEANAKHFIDEIFANHTVNPVEERYPTKKDGFFFIDEKGKITPDFIGLNKYMRDELLLKTKDDCAYIFNGDFYEQVSKLGIDNKIYSVTGLRAGPNHLGNMSKMAKTFCHFEPEFINPATLINLNNGTLDAKSRTLRPFNRNEFFTYKLNHNFIQTGETPVFNKFMSLISTQDDAKTEVIMEFMGYILSGCDYTRLNKILILDGEGANGKTSLINIISNMVGVANCSSESLISLQLNRFASYSLVGKKVNFCAEEPKEAFGAAGVLKKITGNDPIMIEPKHMKSFQYINYAKIIISYNEMPYLSDKTSGMKRRLLIVPCITNLEERPDLKIANLQTAVAPEYGKIISRCLDAFSRVEKSGDFTKVASGIARYEEIELRSDPVLDFIHERVLCFALLTDEHKTSVSRFNMGAVPSVGSRELWAEFSDFNPGSRLSCRGFEMKLASEMKRLPGVEKIKIKNLWTYRGALIAR